jgi:UDP-N-acetylglucosamine 2-epimerase (non-hydrolysing)
MIHILTVFGTRPEAIKLAPVVKVLETRQDRFRSTVCVTAQHREMLDQVLRLFEMTPHYDLNLMKPRQDLFGVTSEVLLGLRDLLRKIRPDLVLVQGDTTTTFAAGLAAYYERIRIGHVEAGLRTGEKYKPFPEEINRRLTTVLADYHFPPTEKAKAHLLREGVLEETVFVTGNTVIDALLWVLEKQSGVESQRRMEQQLQTALKRAEFPERLILVTAHRRESFGEGFEQICMALKAISLRNPGVDIVYPVHLNPHVREPVYRIIGGMERIHLIEPLEYEPFVFLMNRSFLILTDSGGIQEEAPSLGKPVLVMRDVTERPEAIEAGTARLVGSQKDRIAGEAQRLLDDPLEYRMMTGRKNPYGDGKAAERIIDFLSRRL